MQQRTQQTIGRPGEVRGHALFSGGDACLRFLPAACGQGIQFVRRDLNAQPIPARIEFTVPRTRRTAISRDGATVEMTEHVLAALAGLNVDNCTVELDGPEPPGCDGSSLAFAECLLDAGIVDQGAPRTVVSVQRDVLVASEDRQSWMTAAAAPRPGLFLSYTLNYGPASPIRPGNLTVEITPQTFMSELAATRTFLLEREAHAMRAQGYGKRTTARDLLIFGENGPLENELRFADECVRHKLLDCLGDLALCGCDLNGHFSAFRSGHRLNADLVRGVQAAHFAQFAGHGLLDPRCGERCAA